MEDIITLLRSHSDENEWEYFIFMIWQGYRFSKESSDIEITEYYKHIKDFSVCLN
jgi:hypothetical protein